LHERDDAAAEMLRLVARIAGFRRQPGLLVFVQNGSAILDVPRFDVASYVRTVDGIGLKDTFYFSDADENNSLEIQADVVDLMTAFTFNGKRVLAVDYVTDEAKVADFCARARAEEFVPLVTMRALDRVPEPYP
jgi:uncharacterized protein (TIGR01370 family)